MAEQLVANIHDISHEVYGYPFPEVRTLLDGLRLPQKAHMSTIGANQMQDVLEVGGYDFAPTLELEENSDGYLDRIALAGLVARRIQARNQPLLPGLSGFDHQYPSHGSSGSIFRLLAEWHNRGKLRELATVEGEYEGIDIHTLGLNIARHSVKSLEDAGTPKDGRIWYVSNPSAVNGNWHSDEVWQAFVNNGHTIIVDAAYVGLTADTRPHPLDVSAPNIEAVVTSPSKIFGVFNHRYIGVTYTRQTVLSLMDTPVFMDVPALLDTLMLYQTFGPHELPDAYRPWQQHIVETLAKLIGNTVLPSNAILLAHASDALPQPFDQFRRASAYRFGLKNLFEKLEQYRSTQ